MDDSLPIRAYFFPFEKTVPVSLKRRRSRRRPEVAVAGKS